MGESKVQVQRAEWRGKERSKRGSGRCTDLGWGHVAHQGKDEERREEKFVLRRLTEEDENENENELEEEKFVPPSLWHLLVCWCRRVEASSLSQMEKQL